MIIKKVRRYESWTKENPVSKSEVAIYLLGIPVHKSITTDRNPQYYEEPNTNSLVGCMSDAHKSNDSSSIHEKIQIMQLAKEFGGSSNSTIEIYTRLLKAIDPNSVIIDSTGLIGSVNPDNTSVYAITKEGSGL